MSTSVARGAPSTRGPDILIPVYFAVSSSQITEASEETVRAILERLASPQAKAVLEGYASSDGDESWNLVLSGRRADALKALLVGRGADASRITTVGMGSVDPIASNETPEGRARNRRVEVKFQ